MTNPLLRPNDPRFVKPQVRDAEGKNRFGESVESANEGAATNDVYAAAAADAYERVLQIDKHNLTASQALENIYRNRGSWNQLSELLLARVEFPFELLLEEVGLRDVTEGEHVANDAAAGGGDGAEGSVEEDRALGRHVHFQETARPRLQQIGRAHV